MVPLIIYTENDELLGILDVDYYIIDALLYRSYVSIPAPSFIETAMIERRIPSSDIPEAVPLLELRLKYRSRIIRTSRGRDVLVPDASVIFGISLLHRFSERWHPVQ